MKGHLRRRGKRSWAIVVDEGRGPDGRRRQRWHSFKGSRKDAEAKLIEIVRSLDVGEYVQPSKFTVGSFLEHWLTHSAKPSTTGRTLQRYEQIVRGNITPQLGQIPLGKLQPLPIQQFYSWVLTDGRLNGKGGLSARTAHHIHRVLHRALNQAVRWQILSRNPAAAVEPPRPSKSEMRVLTESESARLLKALEGSPIYLIVLIALVTGMRRGEILALTWGDIDLLRGLIRVTKTLEQTKDAIIVKSPKTEKSRRSVPIPALLVAALKAYKTKQARHRLQLGPAYNEQAIVCARPDGTHWKPDSLSKEFQRFMRTVDLPRIRFHDLRHTHATQLMKQAVHPKVVAERLGHSSITLTLDTYTHVLPGLQEEAARQLDRTLKKAIKEAN